VFIEVCLLVIIGIGIWRWRHAVRKAREARS
jgi:hypothetical protein